MPKLGCIDAQTLRKCDALCLHILVELMIANFDEPQIDESCPVSRCQSDLIEKWGLFPGANPLSLLICNPINIFLWNKWVVAIVYANFAEQFYHSLKRKCTMLCNEPHDIAPQAVIPACE